MALAMARRYAWRDPARRSLADHLAGLPRARTINAGGSELGAGEGGAVEAGERTPGWWRAPDGSWRPPARVGPVASPSGQAGLVVPVSALPGPTVIGTPGASAKAKAARIHKMAEAWETGSAGEEHTAAQLTRLPPSFFVLHDLHVPGSDANIDHLVVGPMVSGSSTPRPTANRCGYGKVPCATVVTP